MLNDILQIITKPAESLEKLIEKDSNLNDLNVLIAECKMPFQFMGQTPFKRLFSKQFEDLHTSTII